MVRNVKHLQRYELIATDGTIGRVDDFYFDDERWVIRYLVVDTGNWLPGRQVLISPFAIDRPDWIERKLSLSITREQVKNSPPIETHKPVSRQYEIAYANYFGYPFYWTGATVWGPTPHPVFVRPPAGAELDARVQAERYQAARRGDEHLRSTKEVMGYHLQATDGELGHVEDFLVDDLDWALRYIVVDTSNRWFGRHVLIPPDWIRDVSWRERQVTVDVDRETVKAAPEFDSVEHVNRQWEADYYAHYRRPGYWITAEEARKLKAAHDYPADSPG